MQSGFTGGGGGGGHPDLYANRSTFAAAMNNNQQPFQPPYGRSPNLPGLFLDHAASRVARQSPHATTLIGKRTLAEFQSHQAYGGGLGIPSQANYLRSVKPRLYQHSSPISPLSPMEFSPATPSSDNSTSSSVSPPSQRFGMPISLQQFRPQSLPYGLSNGFQNHNRMVVPGADSEKKMMNNKLQELEKQLLDDDDDDGEGGEADPASAITTGNSNSEWSETIQNLISTAPSQNQNQNQNQNQKPPVSSSPTSSSSSSSSSVASPASATFTKQSIMEAASAVCEGKTESAAEILTRLGQASGNPKLTAEQKVLEFMASALKSRINPTENPPSVGELFGQDHAAATQSLHDLSPCFRSGFSAANLAIIDATLSEQPAIGKTSQRVHVIDFDIGQGGQYASLLHSLASPQNINSASNLFSVKITTVADTSERERLKVVTEKLTQLGDSLGIRLEINAVSVKISDLSRESLGLEPDEPIAVNFAFKLYRTPDESVSTENPRDELLRRVKAMRPRVVVLVEQEVNTNTAPFMARVNESCAYYSALLGSVESAGNSVNSERVKAEEAVRRKLSNSVACEGRDRVERCEVFGKWKARMGMAGFELKPLSQNVKTQLSSRNRVHPGFSVKEENGGICFGWMGRTLTVASTWR